MACMGALSQTRAVLALSEACERNKGPILEVLRSEFAASGSVAPVDAVFSANTLHIIAWSAVRDFVRGVAGALTTPGVLCVYGPFRFHGQYTSDSNAQFDAYLKARDPVSGIRDFEALEALARAQGLVFAADHAMPANNRVLVWRRPPGARLA
jgi:uncharacterized protein DUF938